ncbi:MAG: cytochrome b6-f complex subunit PetL [Microcystaceae cyanobacterium]
MSIFVVGAYIGYLVGFSVVALGLYFGFRAIKLI